MTSGVVLDPQGTLDLTFIYKVQSSRSTVQSDDSKQETERVFGYPGPGPNFGAGPEPGLNPGPCPTPNSGPSPVPSLGPNPCPGSSFDSGPGLDSFLGPCSDAGTVLCPGSGFGPVSGPDPLSPPCRPVCVFQPVPSRNTEPSTSSAPTTYVQSRMLPSSN